jgi:malate dehydrogenase (oxaloacetate-decarboxylating)
VFPAIGLGVLTSRARRVTDAMLNAAARALGALSPALDDQYASLLPPINQLRSTAVQVATTVAITAVHEGVAPYADDEALRARVAAAQWTPQYT